MKKGILTVSVAEWHKMKKGILTEHVETVAERGTNFSIAKQLRSSKKWKNHVAVSLRMRPYTSTNQIILRISKNFLCDPTKDWKPFEFLTQGTSLKYRKRRAFHFWFTAPISHPKKHRKARGNVLKRFRETMCVFSRQKTQYAYLRT